jgi:hypothetical protein
MMPKALIAALLAVLLAAARAEIVEGQDDGGPRQLMTMRCGRLYLYSSAQPSVFSGIMLRGGAIYRLASIHSPSIDLSSATLSDDEDEAPAVEGRMALSVDSREMPEAYRQDDMALSPVHRQFGVPSDDFMLALLLNLAEVEQRMQMRAQMLNSVREHYLQEQEDSKRMLHHMNHDAEMRPAVSEDRLNLRRLSVPVKENVLHAVTAVQSAMVGPHSRFTLLGVVVATLGFAIIGTLLFACVVSMMMADDEEEEGVIIVHTSDENTPLLQTYQTTASRDDELNGAVVGVQSSYQPPQLPEEKENV